MIMLLHIPSRQQLDRRRTYFAFSFIADQRQRSVRVQPVWCGHIHWQPHAPIIVNSRKWSSGNSDTAARL